MSQKSNKLYMTAYCSNGYPLWDDEERKVVQARNVIFNEEKKQMEKDKRTIYLDLDTLEENEYSKKETDTKERREERIDLEKAEMKKEENRRDDEV